ncbi:unnamed protein product [Ectocarpus fasciculatus]
MQTYGNPDASKTVVFLHGIMGNKRNWRNPSLLLVKANPDVRCITMDLRGHGDSQYFPGENTVQNCADDLHETFQKFNIQPTVLSAHSFGGKVALKYLEMTREVVKAPETTWILDSMPGKYSMNPDKNSVMTVLEVVKSIPKTFPSRDWLLTFLTKEKKLTMALAQWLATNAIGTKEEYYLGLNINTILELMTDFCNLDAWPILENYDGEENITYLRAANNLNWSQETLDRLRAIESRNDKVKLLEMSNVGHWLHAEDPAGLLAIMRAHSDL